MVQYFYDRYYPNIIRIFICIVATITLICISQASFAEIKTFEREDTYQASEVDSEDLFQKAVGYSLKNDFSNSLDMLNRVIEIKPVHPSAYQYRGQVKNFMGDYTGAMKDLNIAIKIDSKDYDAFSSRGETKYALGDYTDPAP